MLQPDCARRDRRTHDAERPRVFTTNIKVSADDNRTAKEDPAMMAGRDSLLKSDDEEELVFDQTGLLTNKLSSRHGVLSRTLVVNSGGRLTIARTVNLCLSFFGLGLCFAIPTATIQDLQRRTNSEKSIEYIYTARYGGYIFGCLIGGFLFDWYNRQFLLFLSIFATSIGIVVMPFCAQLSTLMACSAITGITMGFLDTGGNVWCLDLWGRHSAPFMQGLHFCFALGALVAPLIAEPFLSPAPLMGMTVPQHTQPLHPGNSSLPVDNFGHIPSIGIHHGIAISRPLPHQLVSSPALEFLQRDRPRRRRRDVGQTTPSSGLSAVTNVTEHVANNVTQLRTTALPLTAHSTTSTSVSTASPIASVASSSPAPTLVAKTGNSTGGSSTGVNGTDLLQSRMDNDNITASQTSASVDVTTAVKKPTKPLYAEGAVAKNKWDRESQKPVPPQPVPAPTPNATATSNSSVSKNATVNGTMLTTTASSSSVSSPAVLSSTTAPTSSSVSSSVAPSSTAAPSSGSVPSSTTSPSSSSFSSSVLSLTAVSSSSSAKPSVTEFLQTSTSPSVPKNQTLSPSSGTVVTEGGAVPTNVARLNSNTTMPSTSGFNPTTQPDYTGETVLPTNVASTTPEPVTTRIKIDTQPVPTPSSSTATVPKLPSTAATTKTPEESVTVTAGSVTTVTDAATTTSKRSSEKFAATEPNIPKVDSEKLEVQTVPSTSSRKPSITTTTTTASTVMTTPPPETFVPIPTSRPDIVPNVNITEDNGLTLEQNGTLRKTPEANPSQTTGLTSWILDKFKQNRLGKLEFVYAILGTYLFVVSAVFLVFLCTNPRETRSRQEEDVKVQGPSSKWSLVLLSSLFFFLYMGMEAAVGELLHIYAVPQTPGAPLPRGYLLTYVFWGSFAAARGIAVVAAIKVSCRTMLLGDLGVCFLASVLLVVGADRMDALLWAGVGVLGVGMASVLPTSLAWLERHVRVTNRIASVVLLGAAMGEMVLPFLASHLVDREPAVVVYVNVTVVTLCCLNFGVLWLAAAKRGEKYAVAKPDRSQYQLANLDDVDESADFTLLRPLCANGDDGHALLVTGKPRARFLRDPDVATS